MSEVGTKAGRALLDRWFPNGKPHEYQGASVPPAEHPVWIGLVNSILAIENEAAMNGWNNHIEAIGGSPERASFMEGYGEARDTFRERLTQKINAAAVQLWEDTDDPDGQIGTAGIFIPDLDRIIEEVFSE
jgi:hypothetical protein